MRIYTLGTGETSYYTFLVQIHVILIQTVFSNLAVRSVQNSAVELSRCYSVVMKSFISMYAQNKFYYKGVSEQHIVASVAKFAGQRF